MSVKNISSAILGVGAILGAGVGYFLWLWDVL